MARTFRHWLRENLEPSTIEDVERYGADAGFGGLSTYRETGELYERYGAEIWDALDDDAADFGHESPLALIATFNGAADVGTPAQFENLLVWYMAEREARALVDSGELEEEEEIPEPGDYTLTPAGPLGGRVALAEVGRGMVGTYATEEDALEEVRERSEAESFYPNVWRVSDHGNLLLIEDW